MRLAYTWRRAVNTNMASNLATAVAFLANMIGPIMPINAIGIYAAVIIPINFVGIITVLPAAIIRDERHLQPCFRAMCGCSETEEEQQIEYPPEVLRAADFVSPEQLEFELKSDAKNETSEMMSDEEELRNDLDIIDVDVSNLDETDSMEVRAEGGENLNMVLDSDVVANLTMLDESDFFSMPENSVGLAWFFGGPFNRNVYRAKQWILAGSFAWIIVCILSIMEMKNLSTVEGILPASHDLTWAHDVLQGEFDGGDQTSLMVNIFFGVDRIDKNFTNVYEKRRKYWDPQHLGEPVMNPWLDVSSQECQKAIKNLCADLRSKHFVRHNGLKCWIEDFEEYLQGAINSSLPVD